MKKWWLKSENYLYPICHHFYRIAECHAAESCLRRALEALFDLGRHILAKGFAEGVTDYKDIAVKLEGHDVITPELGEKMKLMAGYEIDWCMCIISLSR